MSKAHVEALLRAREIIKSGMQHFICIALDVQYTGAANRVKKQIGKDLLHGAKPGKYAVTYEEWLDDHDILDDKEISRWEEAKVKRSRLAWIDAMIEYWRDK